jgi:hypothetical protein
MIGRIWCFVIDCDDCHDTLGNDELGFGPYPRIVDTGVVDYAARRSVAACCRS